MIRAGSVSDGLSNPSLTLPARQESSRSQLALHTGRLCRLDRSYIRQILSQW